MVAPAGSAALAPVKAANVIDPTVAAVPGWPDGDVVVDEGTVVKTGDDTPGIGTVTNGTTTIKAGSISTDGSVSAGIRAEGSGQITIDVGTVETAGWRSDGIFATTNVGGSTGGIAITAGSVSTTGDLSNAITATAYRGDVTIDVGQVKAIGYGSGGIYANAGQGNATVTAGTVETTGNTARGLVAYSNGATKVVVDSVSTVGGGAFQDANSGAIIAMGTSVEVQAGSVSTQGEYSDGIYATSNFAYDNGQASHDVSVTAGSVSTAGNHAAGVVAVNRYGDNHIDVGTVKTTGDFAPGVYGVSIYGGNTNIKAGEVSTTGYASHGVFGKAVFGGDVTIDVGKVTTAGDNSPAVYGLAFYGDVAIKAGEVSTSGYYSGGIVGIGAYGGHVGIQAGKVTTTGDYSAGIEAISGTYGASAGGGIDIDIQDGITTSGKGSHGVAAYSIYGDINIAAKGDIVTSGLGATGIAAVSYLGDINIDVGKVETAGLRAVGVSVFTIGGDVSIHADNIATTGDYADGISVFALHSNADVTVGDISTDGTLSFGASVGGDSVNVHVTNNIVTGGDYSIGANVQAYVGDGNLTVGGSAITKGFASTALVVRAADDATVNAGSVHTYGDRSNGIVATTEHGDITVNVGDITTQGMFSSGMVATSLGESGGVTINGTGTIHVSGYGSNGIDVISNGGPIKIDNPGTIQVDGYYGIGIYALMNGGDGTIDIKAGDIITNGVHGAGVVALGNTGAVNIDVGDIKAMGYGSLGIVGISNGGGDVTVKAGDLDIKGQAVLLAGDGNLNLEAGNVYASGLGVAGVEVVGAGNANINVGNVAVAGSYSAGISVDVGGSATVKADNVSASGLGFASAIEVRASTADVQVSGNVYAYGYGSKGVLVRSYGGDTNVKVDGSVGTEGFGATGIYAGASGNVTVAAKDIHTYYFGHSAGAIVFSSGGNVSAATGNISTEGADSLGIYAGIRDIYGTGFKGDITISTGNVSTRGTNSAGLVGVNYSVGGNISITAGDVATRRENAIGAYALAFYGSAKVDVGNVSTLGAESHGVYVNVQNQGEAIVKSVSTRGDEAAGVVVMSFEQSKVKVGTVVTEGDSATGIFALAGSPNPYNPIHGKVDISAQSVATHGYGAIGVVGLSQLGDVAITAGTVTTTDGKAIGVNSHAGFGVNAVTVGTVSTKGSEAHAALLSAYAGTIDLVAGNVTTEGYAATGIRTFSAFSQQNLTVDNITTAGDGSWGILAHSVKGGIDIKVNGTVTVTGDHAAGIRTNNSYGHVAVDAANVITTGDKSAGVYVFQVGTFGERTADIKVGSIKTSGAESHGIGVYNIEGGVIAYSQSDSAVATAVTAKPAEAGVQTAIVTPVKFGPSDPVKGGSIQPPKTGAINPVKLALAEPGAAAQGSGLHDITIEAGKIEVGGTGANGIFVRGAGRVTTKVGTVTAADAEGIKIAAREENTLAVTGTVSSGHSDAVFLSGSDISVTLASGGKISGFNGISALANGTQPDGGIGIPGEPGIGLPEGPEDPGIGIGIRLPGSGGGSVLAGPVGGTARIENAGTIIGTARAIGVDAGTAIIVNKGVIDGAVVTGNGDDSFVNSGTWIFSTASTAAANDFGVGTDTLVNSGIVRLATRADGKAGEGWINGLDRFENSGTLSLQNGVAGDILTLGGDYVASGKAKLGIDIGGNGKVADMLVVEGAATGTTTISLVNTDRHAATLLGAPLKIVTVGAGSSANAFTLETPDIGFVRYGLRYDTASRSYSVLSTAGAPVYRFARLNEGAQSIWLKSAEAFTGHMRSSRDLGDPGKRIWGQMSGGVANRDETRAVAGGNGFAAASYDLDYRQDFYGGELGFDAVQGEGVTAGVMGGYTSSTQRFKANGDKGRTDALNVGVYGGVTKGAVFANLLVKYDHFSTHVSSQEMDWNDKIGGHSIGAQGEVGARLGSAKFFVEPAASLAWQSTSLGDIEALDQKIAFDKADGLRGRIGARLGGVTKLGGTELTFYGAGDFVHEFKGKDGATLLSAGQSVWVPGARMDDYGQATLGLDIKGSGPVSGFIQGSGTFGSSYSGVDGRAGIRFAF